jgi:hypothetical protein
MVRFLIWGIIRWPQNRIARAVWAAIEPTHRSVVSVLLRRLRRRTLAG